MTTIEQPTRARPAYREVEVDVEVRRRETVADGVVTLTLADPSGADLPEWAPGAHIDLLMTPSLVRQYSLCGDTANRAEWQVGVLLDPNSRGGSQFVHDKLHEGATVRVRGPRNHFPLVGSPRYLFIAGGIGDHPNDADDRGGRGGRCRLASALRRQNTVIDGLRRRRWSATATASPSPPATLRRTFGRTSARRCPRRGRTRWCTAVGPKGC